MQAFVCDVRRARTKLGRAMASRTPMTMMTTIVSRRVKPQRVVRPAARREDPEERDRDNSKDHMMDLNACSETSCQDYRKRPDRITGMASLPTLSAPCYNSLRSLRGRHSRTVPEDRRAG